LGPGEADNSQHGSETPLLQDDRITTATRTSNSLDIALLPVHGLGHPFPPSSLSYDSARPSMIPGLMMFFFSHFLLVSPAIFIRQIWTSVISLELPSSQRARYGSRHIDLETSNSRNLAAGPRSARRLDDGCLPSPLSSRVSLCTLGPLLSTYSELVVNELESIFDSRIEMYVDQGLTLRRAATEVEGWETREKASFRARERPAPMPP
jgi:hypothetical protein